MFDIIWTAEHFVTKLGIDAAPWARASCRKKKKLFAIFKVKVTVSSDMIEMWLFLLCTLNYWFFGSQTWSDDTSSWARVPQDQGHSEGLECQYLSRWYLLNCQTFGYQPWYCDAASQARVSCKKIGLLFSRSRSQQGFIWPNYDRFYYIFWTADPFATKLGLIVHYKPEWLIEKLHCSVHSWSECFVKKLDCCFQG